LSYTQPLLRNYGGELDRLDYELAEYEVDVSELQADESKEGFLLTLANGFIDWVLLKEQERIAEERLQLADAERELTAEKRRANLVDKVDVLRSEDAVRLARQNLVLIRSQAGARQAELAVLAQLPDLRELQPEHDLYELRDLPTVDQAARDLEETSRTLLMLTTRSRQLEQLREGFLEREKPSLNADLGVALKGGDEGFFHSLEITKPDLSVGVSISHPIGARSARSDVLQTELELQQLEAQRQRIKLELESRLHSLLIQLNDLEEILELNREQIESARQKTAEERRLYDQGRSELTFVIQAEDNERNARLTYAENAANYHRLYQQYLALSDQLLPIE
jgi:outer membrane protein TolC